MARGDLTSCPRAAYPEPGRRLHHQRIPCSRAPHTAGAGPKPCLRGTAWIGLRLGFAGSPVFALKSSSPGFFNRQAVELAKSNRIELKSIRNVTVDQKAVLHSSSREPWRHGASCRWCVIVLTQTLIKLKKVNIKNSFEKICYSLTLYRT